MGIFSTTDPTGKEVLFKIAGETPSAAEQQRIDGHQSMRSAAGGVMSPEAQDMFAEYMAYSDRPRPVPGAPAPDTRSNAFSRGFGREPLSLALAKAESDLALADAARDGEGGLLAETWDKLFDHETYDEKVAKVEDARAALQAFEEANPSTGFRDIRGVGEAASFAGEALGGEARDAATVLSATGIGAGIGSVVPLVGPAVGAAAGRTAGVGYTTYKMIPQLFSEALQAQEEAGRDPDVVRAALTTAGNAGIEALADWFTFGLPGKGGLGVSSAVNKGLGAALRRGAKRATTEALRQGLAEGAQTINTREMNGLNWDDEEGLWQLAESIAAGMVVGGSVGGAIGSFAGDGSDASAAQREIEADARRENEELLREIQAARAAATIENPTPETVRSEEPLALGFEPETTPTRTRGPGAATAQNQADRDFSSVRMESLPLEEQKAIIDAREAENEPMRVGDRKRTTTLSEIQRVAGTAAANREAALQKPQAAAAGLGPFSSLDGKPFGEAELDAAVARVQLNKRVSFPVVQKAIKDVTGKPVSGDTVRAVMSEMEARGVITKAGKKGGYVVTETLAKNDKTAERQRLDRITEEINEVQQIVGKETADLRSVEQTGKRVGSDKVIKAATVRTKLEKAKKQLAKLERQRQNASLRLGTIDPLSPIPRTERTNVEEIDRAKKTLDELKRQLTVVRKRIDNAQRAVRRDKNNAQANSALFRHQERRGKLQQEIDVTQAAIDGRPVAEAAPSAVGPSGPRLPGSDPRQASRGLGRPAEAPTAGAGAGAAILSPEYTARFGEVLSSLKSRLNKMGLGNLRLALSDTIRDADGNVVEGVDGVYQNLMINLATRVYDPNLSDAELTSRLSGVMDHEIIHALRDMGVITDAEWSSLTKSAESRRVVVMIDGKKTRRNYTHLDRAKRYYENDSFEVQQEEAVAEMFRAHTSGLDRLAGRPQNVFNKIINFVKAMFGANQDAGFYESADIFQSIESGEVGGRTPSTTTAPSPARASRRGSPNLSDPNEGLTATEVAMINPIYGGGASIPAGRVPANADVARWMEDRFEGDEITNFKATLSPERLREIGNVMAAEVLHALQKSGNASDWYSGAMAKAMGMASIKWPMLSSDQAAADAGFGTAANARFAFTFIMAVTSQNLDVDANAKATNKAFDAMVEATRGLNSEQSIPSMSKSWGTGDKRKAMGENFAKFKPLVESMAGETFSEKLANLDEMFRKKKTVKDWVIYAKRFGIPFNPPSSTVMTAEVYGSSVLGPKIGNGFWQNLNGNYNPLTIDLWMRRTWGRLTGKSIGNPEGLPKQRSRLRASIKRSRSRTTPDEIGFAEAYLSGMENQLALLDPEAFPTKKAFEAEEKYYKAEISGMRETLADLRNLKAPETWRPAYSKDDVALLGYAKRLEKAWKTEYDILAEQHDKEVLDGLQPTWAKAAKTIITNLGKPIDQISNGTQRIMVEQAAAHAKAVLQTRGVDVTTADLQAILWYPEKELWGAVRDLLKVGADGLPIIPPSKLNVSYDTAFARILEGEGYDPTEIAGASGDGAGGVRSGTVTGQADAGPTRPGERRKGEGDVRRDARGGGGEERYSRRGLRGPTSGDGAGGTGGRSIPALKGAPTVRGVRGPDPRLVSVAERYAAANGIDLKRQDEFVEVDPERAARISDAYDQMQDSPQDPVVAEAYQNMIEQTVAQYEALIADGYKFYFIDMNTPEGQQYASSPFNAIFDLRNNKRMGVFSTADGYGDGTFDVANNPMLADTGNQWTMGPSGQRQPAYANDLFRAVHDAFGHGLEFAGFRARGEENAWQAHVRLFTGSAVGAITSETRGQNSWLNYGPHGENNRAAQVENTIFAKQKTGLMPEWTWTEGRAGDDPAPRYSRVGLPDATETPANIKYDPGPNDQYIPGKQREAQRDIDAGGKGLNGATTAYVRDISLPVDMLADIPGALDEKPAPGNGKYDDLLASVTEEGFRQDSPIMIRVNHLGEPYIMEGNNRLAVAKAAGVESIPVEISWMNGAEAASGPLTPEAVTNERPASDPAPMYSRRGLPAAATPATVTRILGSDEDIVANRAMEYTAIADYLAGKLGRYVDEDNTKAAVNKFLRITQDSWLPVGRMVKLAKDSGLTMRNVMDPYLRQQLSKGKVGEQIEYRMETGVYKAMKDAAEVVDVTPAMKSGLIAASARRAGAAGGLAAHLFDTSNPKSDRLSFLDTYLYALHAPERNAYVKMIDPARSSETDMDRGGSGMSNAEAQDIIDWFDANVRGDDRARLDTAAAAFKAIIADTNDVKIRGGLIPSDFATTPIYADAQDVDTSRRDGAAAPVRHRPPNWDNYGPLWGVNDNDSTRGFDVPPSPVPLKMRDRAVRGRGSYGDNLIANAITQNQSAIIRSEENQVRVSLLELIQQHGRENGTPDEMAGWAKVITRAPQKRAVVKDAHGNKTVRWVNDLQYKNRDNIAIVKKDGEEIIIEFDNSPNGLSVADVFNEKNIWNPGQMRAVLNGLGKVNRYLSSVLTTWNPEFVFTNMSRDAIGAQLNMSEYEVKGFNKEVLANMPSALKAIRAALRNDDYSGPMGDVYRQFKASGAQSSANPYASLDSSLKKLELANKNGGMKGTKKVFKALGKFMEDYNMVAENGIRLSVFKGMIDRGVSSERAAQAARTVTVDFQKTGDIGALMNAGYLFYNASIQGSVLMLRAGARSKKVRKMMAGVIVAGAVSDMLNSMMSEEDEAGIKEWDKTQDWQLEHYLTFMLPGGMTVAGTNRLSIPLPYGLNAFFNTGRAISKAARQYADTGELASSTSKAGKSIMSTGLEIFNPLGGAESFLNFVSPTIADPFIDVLGDGKDFSGQDIRKTPFPGQTIANSQLYWGNTGEVSKEIAQMMNKAFGGTETISASKLPWRMDWMDPSPDTLEYWFDFMTGGAGKFVRRSAEFGIGSAAGDKEPAELMTLAPFARIFFRGGTDREDSATYFEYRDRVLLARSELLDARKAGDRGRVLSARSAYADDLRIAGPIYKLELARKKIVRQIRAIKENDNIPEERKTLLIERLQERRKAIINRSLQIMMRSD